MLFLVLKRRRSGHHVAGRCGGRYRDFLESTACGNAFDYDVARSTTGDRRDVGSGTRSGSSVQPHAYSNRFEDASLSNTEA